MRGLAAVGMALVLCGCAALPFETGRSVVTVEAPAENQTARAPRRSQQELLAAYWAERRAPRILTSADFTPVDFIADASARNPTILQNFPVSADSEDQAQLDALRLERESAATREAVRAALLP